MDALRFLSGLTPFKTLPAPALSRLARQAVLDSFPKGSVLFHEGEKTRGIWVVKEGRAAVQRDGADGKGLTLEDLGPGALLGILCRVSGEWNAYPCTVAAATTLKAYRLPEALFRRLLSSESGFIQEICALCAGKALEFQRRTSAAHEPVPARVAGAILRLVKTHGQDIPLTKREVAALAGAALNTTFRVFARLEKKGFISSRYGGFRVEDPKALSSFR